MPRTGAEAEIPPHGGPLVRTRVFVQRHWRRGAPGSPTPEWVVHYAFSTWLIALLLKLVGSSWDMSWHFRWLRDDLAMPHLINSVGSGMVCALVLVHTYTGLACDRRSLRLMQAGLVTFLIAAPLDVINHRVSGLDLTAWSPTHALLYIGTAIMIAGVIDAWMKFAAPGRIRTATLTALWIFFLENAYFANGQQEYGILALRAWERGEPDAEQSLLQFAADQIGHSIDREAVIHFALPIENWVYPAWGVGVMALLLALARLSIGRRWSATAVAFGYVAYRAAIWPMLVVGGFPPSTVPFYLVFVGLAVDAAFVLGGAVLVGRSRALGVAVSAGVLVSVFGFSALWLQSQLRSWVLPTAQTESAPEIDYLMAPVVLVGVGGVMAATGLTAGWWRTRARRTPPEVVPDVVG